MRSWTRSAAVAAALVALPLPLVAQTFLGIVKQNGACGTNFQILPNGGELYAVKVTSVAGNPGSATDPTNYDDWQASMESKTAGSTIGLSVGDIGPTAAGFQVLSANFQDAPLGTHVVFTYITFPNGMLYVDSGTVGNNQNLLGNAMVQVVGNSAPATHFPGTAAIAMSSAVGGYTVNTGAAPAQFPFGTKAGIELAFAPVNEVNNTQVGGCAVGGRAPDPATTQGAIIGYNIYRMVAPTPTPAPTAAQLGTVANWVAFYPLTSFTLNPGSAEGGGTVGGDANGDTIPDGDGTDSARDGAADTDAYGIENADGVQYTGDEIAIFADGSALPNGTARATAPILDGVTQYWYAVQPVVNGSISAFQNITLARNPLGDVRRDENGAVAGPLCAVDLDVANANGNEFFSPQFLSGGLPGLGLTNGGEALLSTPVLGRGNPAAAGGNLSLMVDLAGSDVNLSLSAGLEAANVLGYNVYRSVGAERTKVNADLIAASGGEGSVYRLVDSVGATSRRVTRRDLAPSYEVEVVYNDGTQSRTFGPFSAAVASEQPVRRTR